MSNCYLWDNNENAKHDLTNIVHEEVVENCFNTIAARSVTDIIVAICTRDMNPQGLAETFSSSLQLSIHERYYSENYSKGR